MQITVRSDDQVEVTVDGDVWVAGPIDRDSLGRVLGTIVSEKDVPVRVELTEADGRRFADILTPRTRRSVFAPPTDDNESADRTKLAPLLRRIEAAGFVPGEDVGIAIITRAGSAGHDGIARTIVDTRDLPDGHLGVLLFGFVSGTISHDHLRS
ncbi:hypothetical protein [Microbacterium sp. NPDC056234]|uniref:hypothetical protein n=1 Tax=Microbacterium sp. NPDC056234 TaxID=3345757 RepID=UPI0035DB2553